MNDGERKGKGGAITAVGKYGTGRVVWGWILEYGEGAQWMGAEVQLSEGMGEVVGSVVGVMGGLMIIDRLSRTAPI